MSENTSINEVLRRIDGREPEALKELVGHHDFKRFFLYIDLVERRGGAFIALVRARALKGNANFPAELWNTNTKRIALEDCIARLIRKAVTANSAPQPEPRGGKRGGGRQRNDSRPPRIVVEAGRQEIIERTAVRISPYWVEARIEVALPGHGNRIHGKEASEILTRDLPNIIERCILWENMPHERVCGFVDSAVCYELIQTELATREILGFVADNSIVARANRGGELPMDEDRVVKFTSPDSLKIEIDLPPILSLPSPAAKAAAQEKEKGKEKGEPPPAPVPQPRKLSGMAIQKGITVIVGPRGAGKSTLLRGIQQGIYAHVPGDGRERLVTAAHSVKVSADEGRIIGKLDISNFITALPSGRDPKAFYAKHATETESFVAALIEAVEAGAKFLLIDQDLTPSELLFQDPRIAKLVNSSVTPLAKRIKDLWDNCGISSLIVTESYGDFLAIADRVLLMQDFKLTDITEETKKICSEVPAPNWDRIAPFASPATRIPLRPKLDGASGPNPFGIRVESRSEIMVRNTKIDLRALEQIGDRAQVQGIGYALHYILLNLVDGEQSISQILDRFEEYLSSKGFDYLSPFYADGKHPGDFARPRREELQQILNRLPFIRMKRAGSSAAEVSALEAEIAADSAAVVAPEISAENGSPEGEIAEEAASADGTEGAQAT